MYSLIGKSKQDFSMTPLILGLSCEPDFISHQISYPSSIFLLLLAWLVENYRLFLLLISWQFEKKWELLRSLLSVFPYTHVCDCTRFLSLCFQGEVCMPLVISTVLILPDIRPEMWLPCKRPNWEQSGKSKYSKSCLQDLKVMWSAKEAEMFA